MMWTRKPGKAKLHGYLLLVYELNFYQRLPKYIVVFCVCQEDVKRIYEFITFVHKLNGTGTPLFLKLLIFCEIYYKKGQGCLHFLEFHWLKRSKKYALTKLNGFNWEKVQNMFLHACGKISQAISAWAKNTVVWKQAFRN